MKTEELSQFLVEHAIQWVQSEREGHRSTARDLTEIEKLEFAAFFDPIILGIAKIKVVPSISNPGFYAQLRDSRLPGLLDFTQAVGITFRDTIIVSQRYLTYRSQLRPLIFHELVHVVQYELLGVEVFIERYVRGWADNGFDYFRVPLEAHAYELQQRYETDSKRGFAVVEEMQRRLGEEQ
ncbi:MAG: hypothetical protein JJE15_07820 [Desulfobacteraceae bacterium]|nr:hypothetical protein [Desulfobacteraceae bacterium]